MNTDGRDLRGKRLGKYEIRDEIGRGGMGAVYRARDPMLDRWVAVKVLAPHLLWEKDFVERFLREARSAAQLRHPNIVTIHDVGQEGEQYYFVMEYLEGQTLTDVIRQRGPMSVQETLRVLRPLADALDYAHRRGLIHRDVKPSNVLIDPSGHVTLSDFGIAKAAQGTRLTATGTMIGTLEYMAPEQMRGLPANAGSDLYSLGVVAYEMLTGQVPFQAESTAALIHKVVYEAPPPLSTRRPDLPAKVAEVLDRVLSKDPAARYASPGEFLNALEGAVALAPRAAGAAPPHVRPAPEATQGVGTRSTPPPVQRPRSTPPPVRPGGAPPRRGGLPGWVWLAGAGGAAVVLLLVFALGLLVVLGGRDPVASAPLLGATPTASSPAPGSSSDAPEPTRVPATPVPDAATPEPQGQPAETEIEGGETGEETAEPTPYPTATNPPTPTPEPTASATPASAYSATITDVQIDGERYAVYFETYGFLPGLPGLHVHFFFDTVPPEQAGAPGSGPWKLYPATAGAAAPSPFTGYGVAERPTGANHMCVLVANGDHSVQQGTGNCFALP